MAHWLTLLSALPLALPKIKAYVKLFEKTPQTERTPLKTIQVDLKFLDKHDSIVSHSLIGQLNQTLMDRKQSLFPVFEA